MRREAGRALALSAGLLAGLAGCGPAESAADPADATVGEARALGEAAEMLSERRAPAALGVAASGAPAPSAAASAPAPR